MKVLSIRLPDVEAAMLVAIQKTNKVRRDIKGMLLVQIRRDYQRVAKKGGKKTANKIDGRR